MMIRNKKLWDGETFDNYNSFEQTLYSCTTNRIAVLDLEWSWIKADDIFTLFSSFLPRNGKLLNVTIYRSNYGFLKQNEKKTNRSHKFRIIDTFIECFRLYEWSKLRCYYVIAEFESKETANLIYSACNGIEFDHTTNVLDLRFVPEHLSFSYLKIHDIALELSMYYEAPLFRKTV